MDDLKINIGNENNGGIELNLIPQLSEKLVNAWLESITEDDLAAIVLQINNEACTTVDKYINGDTCIKVKNIKERKPRDRWSSYDEETPLWHDVKCRFHDKFIDQLNEKIDEILSSDDFKNKVDTLANEVIDYALEGYKKDMVDRIRQRMVGNVLDGPICYDQYDLKQVIHECIRQYLPNQTY